MDNMLVIHLLFVMFQEQENYSILDSKSINDFYNTVCFELESEKLLKSLGIKNAIELQETFIKYNDVLESVGY